IVARLPMVARVEGIHDHDQGVVGLMALDIAAGRRWPVFFDGQRYMGAVEANVAALFTLVLGHRPAVVALAPTLFFGLFVAGQFWVWRRWNETGTARLAAAFSIICAPLPALWSFVPRGGYIEVMAWGIAVLGIYHARVQSETPRLSTAGQVGW